MNKLYVADTTSIISFFNEIFDVECKLSKKAIQIIQQSLNNSNSIRLSIPSIIFIEIFYKFFIDDESAEKIRTEVFEVLRSAENIHIQPLDKEVLENFVQIEDYKINLENHDKIVLASAMMYNCPLITTDTKILKYQKKHRVLPEIIG